MEDEGDAGIVISSDHAGWDLKEAIKSYFNEKKTPIVDLSEPVFDPNDDYPAYAFRLAKAVAAGRFERGIAVCGSGIGASIAANRIRGVRAAFCVSEEMAVLSRKHNNANVLVLGGRFTSPEQAALMIEAWLSTEFEGGRHARRVQQLDR